MNLCGLFCGLLLQLLPAMPEILSMLLCNHPKNQARQQSDHAPNILTATNSGNTQLEAESWSCGRMVGEYSPERRDSSAGLRRGQRCSRPAAPAPNTQPGRHARLLGKSLGRKWRGKGVPLSFSGIHFWFDRIFAGGHSLLAWKPCVPAPVGGSSEAVAQDRRPGGEDW
jgi:hypothetical protein